jgi:deoxyribodipyrimidine photo-lyase
LSELVWRDFYFMILDRFPHVVERSFRPEYDADHLGAGRCRRAGVRRLVRRADGLSAGRRGHAADQRHRLHAQPAAHAGGVVSDEGSGHRLAPGRGLFCRQLNDFDLAANNGGWQWAASTGCDAQPYFRIFNPVTQSERFDPGGRFIRRYLPELAPVPDRFIHAPWRMSAGEQAACGVRVGRETPAPLVDHEEARRGPCNATPWSSVAQFLDVAADQAQQFVLLEGLAEIMIDAEFERVLPVLVRRS